MNSSKCYYLVKVLRMHARTRADSALKKILTAPVCLQTRTLGSDSRSRQSYPGRFW